MTNLFQETAKALWKQKLEENPSVYQHIPKYLRIKQPKILNIRDKLQAEHPEIELLFLNEEAYDKAIIGVQTHHDPSNEKKVKAVAYDQSIVIEVNMEMGISMEDAIDYFDYNQAGAYCGEQSPFFISEFGEDEEEQT